ncbi:DUF2877 domain-containing protein [Nonomuraea pusilla]|uniref:DUF2877 domain-containing protein n=1 Tax=Nonomuraea pusilla TaxID=46177 RepID=UPI003325E826
MTVGTHARRLRAGARTGPGLGPRVTVTGAASTAVRPLLEGPRRPARVLAAFPSAVYLEVRTELEPSVLAVVTGEAARLPNAALLSSPLPDLAVGEEASAGDGTVRIGRLTLRVRRWWDPAPPLGPVDPALLVEAAPLLDPLEHGVPCGDAAPGLAHSPASGQGRPGLAGNEAVGLLAASCASGWLLGAVTAAERLVGLGPGLTPSGDDVLAGLLVTLRQLGAAAGVEPAVRLAGWLAAAVTFDARTRTTPLSATLLHCAARGEAGPEVIGVLRGVAGRQPLEPALRRLRRLGHTSGADLAQGMAIGLASVRALGGAA